MCKKKIKNDKIYWMENDIGTRQKKNEDRR